MQNWRSKCGVPARVSAGAFVVPPAAAVGRGGARVRQLQQVLLDCRSCLPGSEIRFRRLIWDIDEEISVTIKRGCYIRSMESKSQASQGKVLL